MQNTDGSILIKWECMYRVTLTQAPTDRNAEQGDLPTENKGILHMVIGLMVHLTCLHMPFHPPSTSNSSGAHAHAHLTHYTQVNYQLSLSVPFNSYSLTEDRHWSSTAESCNKKYRPKPKTQNPKPKTQNLLAQNCYFDLFGANATVISVVGDFWWEAEKVDSSGVVSWQNKRALSQRHTQADQLTSDRA